MMHPYLKYQVPIPLCSKDMFFISRPKSKIKVNNLNTKKGPFIRYLYVKCQDPIPLGAKDIAHVSESVMPTMDADARVMTTDLWTFVLLS